MKFREALGLVLLKLPLIGDAIVTTTMKILIDAAFNQGETT